jgi:hypothetical protein
MGVAHHLYVRAANSNTQTWRPTSARRTGDRSLLAVNIRQLCFAQSSSRSIQRLASSFSLFHRYKSLIGCRLGGDQQKFKPVVQLDGPLA